MQAAFFGNGLARATPLPSRIGARESSADASTRDTAGRAVKRMADDYDAAAGHATPWTFALASADSQLFASGLHQRLTPGPANTLAERVRRLFADDRDGSGRDGSGQAPDLLVGALPFDRTADDCLFQPETASDVPWALKATGPAVQQRWRVRAEPSRADYERAVARALTIIAALQWDGTPLDKIVLSRSLVLETDTPIDVLALSARLTGDPGAVRFLTPLDPGADGQPRHLVGATPELLISKTGATVRSYPLAGSARRSADPVEDRAAATALMRSDKDQREHRWVVEAILDRLAPLCSDLDAPKRPVMVSTRTMWHLGTQISGRLKHPDDVSAAGLAALLHPTPAVGGTPRERAAALIPELEGYDRGFYAGAVGWTDRAGDGAWYVSLRCAEVSGRRARVFAGAGIVAGSDPAAEADETSAKLQAILRALNIDEDGRPLVA